MKKNISIIIITALCGTTSLFAQKQPPSPATNAPGNYASDIDIVLDAQRQALEQARGVLDQEENASIRSALQTAIKEMEHSQTALEQAKKTPKNLPAAIAAEQAAYQALLKATPREYRMSRSRSRGQGGGGSGQPNQQEMDQLELTGEDKRYETERQATAAPTTQQREQTQTLDRLKQMARRQQDLNERLRDLQTALQEAHTDQEREEIQRQLKRLRDEERQMLSDVDQLRQQVEQSPDAEKQADTRRQLEQTHTDVQRAAQELENQSPSEALAAGSRAEQNLQNLRENMRQQTSSQFTRQMRQLRSQARDLENNENQIAHDLDTLNNSAQKQLDDSAPREALSGQMARQQTALTNLLDQMRAVTEQAEASEPLLSKQLYDILRRADQAHTDSQLEISGQLVDRGFLPQAAKSENAARTNIDELRQGVDRAAESVLGSEAEALRYAQKELDDLAGQLRKEVKGGTNGAASPPGNTSDNPGGNGQDAGANTANNQTNSNQAQQRGNSPGGQGTATAQGQSGAGGAEGGGTNEQEQLRQSAQQLGGGAGGLGENGPITGNNYVDWSERLRDVEQAVDSTDVRNQLATVRERVGVYRRYYRESGRIPSNEELQNKVLGPLALARDWVGQELSRAQNDRSLVPLDRDPVQDKYSDMVRKYYEKLGGSQ
jgi:hypothetical protein